MLNYSMHRRIFPSIFNRSPGTKHYKNGCLFILKIIAHFCPICAILYLLRSNLNPEVNNLPTMNHYILIWSVCTSVETRVREEINLEELALQTGFSLAHIRDVFRRNTGKSLSRYIQERKVANAAQELLYTDKKIIDIAMEYGYSGRTVFSRVFMRHTGYTPSQFRSVRPALTRIRLCAGVFGAGLPQKTKIIPDPVCPPEPEDTDIS